MKVVPGADPAQGSRRAPEEWFTGVVWQEPVFEDAAHPNVKAAWVIFEPGARTHWHRHTDSQLLHVVAGRGRVANRAGESSEMRAGDLVHIPGGEEHWHGAGPSTLVVHLAITIADTDWLDAVSDDDYMIGF